MNILYRIDRMLQSYAQKNLPKPDYILLGDREYWELKNEVKDLYAFNMKQSPNTNDQLYGIDIILVHKETHMSIGFTDRWY